MGKCWSCCLPASVRCLACGTCYTCADPELESGIKGKDFNLEGLRFRAKVVDVYDGDTVTIQFRHGGKICQMKARMAGYDSPEMKPKRDAPHREEEKRAAIVARDALRGIIGDQMVYIHCGEFDKYGRLLVTIFKPCGFLGLKDGHNINEWMMTEKHGVPYGGGTKKEFVPEHAAVEDHEDDHLSLHHVFADSGDGVTPVAGSGSARAIVNPAGHAARKAAAQIAKEAHGDKAQKNTESSAGEDSPDDSVDYVQVSLQSMQAATPAAGNNA